MYSRNSDRRMDRIALYSLSPPSGLFAGIGNVDPDRLLKLWGDREINDGRNISGFIRTADDRYWTTAKVLQELIWDELGDYGTENFSGYIFEDYEIEECVSHPEIEEHYNTKDPGHMCKCEES